MELIHSLHWREFGNGRDLLGFDFLGEYSKECRFTITRSPSQRQIPIYSDKRRLTNDMISLRGMGVIEQSGWLICEKNHDYIEIEFFGKIIQLEDCKIEFESLDDHVIRFTRHDNRSKITIDNSDKGLINKIYFKTVNIYQCCRSSNIPRDAYIIHEYQMPAEVQGASSVNSDPNSVHVFSPKSGISESSIKHKSRWLAHHAFASLQKSPKQQTLNFINSIIQFKRLRYGINSINYLYDVDGREEESPFYSNSIQEYLTHIPMLCFTDVPPQLSEYHAEKYGKLGIVFKHEEMFHLTPHPVKYIWPVSEITDATRLHIYRYYEMLYKDPFTYLDQINNSQIKTDNPIFRSLCLELAFSQQITEPIGFDDYPKSYNYMAENEWRMVHFELFFEFLSLSSNNEREEFNAAVYNGETHFSPFINFKPHQILLIFAPDSACVSAISNALNKYNWEPGPEVITFDEYRKRH